MKLCIKLRILILQTVQCTQCVHLHTGEKCIDAHSAYDSAFLFLSSAGCGALVPWWDAVDALMHYICILEREAVGGRGGKSVPERQCCDLDYQ